MIDRTIIEEFLQQFNKLRVVVIDSRDRSMRDPPDELFYEHQNVFIKSYLVSACSMLEAFIQDLAGAYVEKIQEKINAANLPFNFVVWIAENEKAKLEFRKFEAKKSKSDLSDLVSPNYWKTVRVFEIIGVNVAVDIENYKESITPIVAKRNKIVHHNDAALDLRFADITNTIDLFIRYSECLFRAVSSSDHLRAQ